jgi:hypothetical protein
VKKARRNRKADPDNSKVDLVAKGNSRAARVSSKVAVARDNFKVANRLKAGPRRTLPEPPRPPRNLLKNQPPLSNLLRPLTPPRRPAHNPHPAPLHS